MDLFSCERNCHGSYSQKEEICRIIYFLDMSQQAIFLFPPTSPQNPTGIHRTKNILRVPLGHSHYILRMTDSDRVFFFNVGGNKNKNKISWLPDVGGENIKT